MSDKKTRRAAKKAHPCPRCGSLEIVPILYGYPMPEAMDAAEKGFIALGGCCVGDRDPRKQCKACGEAYDRPPLRASRRAARKQPPRRARRL